MTITYTKYITSMGCYTQIDGESDVVFTIKWQLTGTDDVFNYSILCNTDVPYVAGQPFIPYADLTQEEVIGWVQESLGKDTVEASLATQIEALKNPVTESGLPWATPVL